MKQLIRNYPISLKIFMIGSSNSLIVDFLVVKSVRCCQVAFCTYITIKKFLEIDNLPVSFHHKVYLQNQQQKLDRLPDHMYAARFYRILF